ncbi:MAG: RadC family protein [Flavobacteriaceae bacterium]
MEEKSVSFSIKNWSDADKPREKLMRNGRGLLTNAELISILIGSGNRDESALQLSKRILQAANDDLAELAKLSVEQLMRFKGIGEAKAITIVAAIEIGRRRRVSGKTLKPSINSSNQAYDLLFPFLADLPHEEFWIVYLNNSNRVLHSAQLSKGGITGTIVDVRLVIKKALHLGAVSLILAHNHPSGTLIPSQADKEITQKLIKAANAMEMKVLDHLIISQDSFFSFADNKMIS